MKIFLSTDERNEADDHPDACRAKTIAPTVGLTEVSAQQGSRKSTNINAHIKNCETCISSWVLLTVELANVLTKSLEAIAARTALIPDIKSTCMETFGAVAESYGESELPAEPGAPGQPAEVVEASADGGGDGNGGVLD